MGKIEIIKIRDVRVGKVVKEKENEQIKVVKKENISVIWNSQATSAPQSTC